jgi:ABC-type phosphate transport system substrate-binding protein
MLAAARRPIAIALTTALALAAGALARAAAPPPPPAPFVLIVNKERPEVSLERRFLSRAFLRKTTTWDDGQVIHAVDQSADSPVRQRFSADVVGRSVAAVRNYWQQLIFTGRGVPPPELESDEAVVRYVMKHPGALGYVSGAADVHTAKIVAVR